jgi:hypothetical protein
MDDELFERLYQIVLRLWPRREKKVLYSGSLVLLMYLWTVIRSKPRQWACDRRNLPWPLRKMDIPSPSQFRRRVKSPQVQAMLAELEIHLRDAPEDKMLGCWILDAKPLVVSPYSKDKSAKWGWAYDGKARGYKVFAMSDLKGNVVAWQTRPMNESEPLVARELLKHTDKPGYVIGDSIYDSGPLHELTASRQMQLIAPRKEPGGNIGIRARQPNRLHAIAMLETFNNTFGPAMYAQRTTIERAFSRMASSRVGLDHLPSFVRTPQRVRLWVQGKIILYSLRQKQELRQ